MQRASDLFNKEQRKQVENAVTEAEARTSCEIVPVVATASGRYDRAEDMVGLWLAVLAAITVWLIFPRQTNESGSWDGMSLYVGLLTMVGGVVAAFAFCGPTHLTIVHPPPLPSAQFGKIGGRSAGGVLAALAVSGAVML